MSKIKELNAYLEINTCGAFLWRMQHSIAKGNIKTEEVASDIENIKKQQIKNIKKTTIYGTKINNKEEKPKPTKEYCEWFRKWDSWKDNLSDKEWKELDLLNSKFFNAEKKLNIFLTNSPAKGDK